MGSKSLGLAILESLQRGPYPVRSLILCDDSHDSRSMLAQFVEFAERETLEYEIVKSKKEAHQALRAFTPDIVLVSGWYWLLESELTKMPRLGVWGIHNSILPKYRGGSPLVWALINGESTLGASLFRIGSGMDDGPVAHCFKIHADENSKISDIIMSLQEKVLSELQDVWNGLIDGRITAREQLHEHATYGGLRSQDDGLIDWKLNNVAVHNFIRAQSLPYPCAFTFMSGAKLRISASRLCFDPWQGTPGQILKLNEDGILVACGQRTGIYITRVLSESGTEVEAGTVLRSLMTRLG